MRGDRFVFRVIVVLGLAAVAAFHSAGAIDARDAIAAATIDGSPGARAAQLSVDLVRLVDTRFGLFHALHLAGGVLLAIAAGLSASVAFRLASARPGTGSAAGLFVGTAALFGADLGTRGMEAGSVSLLLALLAGCAAAWTVKRSRALLGGLLLGAAVSVHPFVLFLLPGFLVLARATRPSPPRAALGFVLGLALLHVPPPGGTFGEAIATWWTAGTVGSFWRVAPPGVWSESARAFARAVWGGAGPIGILAGLAGLAVLVRRADASRAFAAMHVVTAAALVLGTGPDRATAIALTVWSFLFLAAPAAVAAGRVLGAGNADDRTSLGGAFRVAGLGLLAGLYLLAANHEALDRSAERGTEWAADSLLPLPAGSVLFTANPVHAALSRDGMRPDVDVVLVGDRRADAIRADVDERGVRRTYLDCSLYFGSRRAGILGEDRYVLPHGLTFRILPLTMRDDDIPQRDRVQWFDLRLQIDSPASPLRGGLSTREYYARSLLQSAYVYLDAALPERAENEFLYALSYGGANRTLAAMGLARVFLGRRDPDGAIRTLEDFLRVDDAGAWRAMQLLGNTYARARRYDDAVRTLRRALPLVPLALPGERGKIETAIKRLQGLSAGGGD